MCGALFDLRTALFQILGQIFFRAFGQSKIFSGDFGSTQFAPTVFFADCFA